MKRYILIGFLVFFMILWGVLASACQPAAQPAATASVTISNTATLSLTPSPTATATPIPDWEVAATFGNGVIPQYLYCEDGSKIVVLQGHTIMVLDGNTMEELSSLELPDEIFNGDDATLECISRDGSLAIISSYDIWGNSLSIIDLISGDIHTEEIHSDSAYGDFSFTPDNDAFIFRTTYFGTKTIEQAIMEWRRSKKTIGKWNKNIYSTQHPEAYMSFTVPALNLDGSKLAAGYSDISTNAIYIWDIGFNNPEIIIENQPTEIINVVFGYDGKWLASISKDSVLRIWDVNDGHLIKQLSGFSEPLSDIELSENGGILTVFYEENLTRVKISTSTWQIVDETLNTATWDSFTRYMLEQNYLLHGGDLHIQFNADGSLLALADGSIQIWDVASKSIKQVFISETSFNVSSMTFSDDNSKLAVRTSNDNVFVWKINSGELFLSITGEMLKDSQPSYTLGANKNEPGSWKLESITFTDDGEFLIIPNGPVMELWDINNQERLRTFEQTPILSFIRKVSLSKNGKTVYALLDSYNRYAAWDFESGAFLYEGQFNESEDGEIWYVDMAQSTIAAYEFSNSINFQNLVHIIDTSEIDKRISKEMIGSSIYGIWLSSDENFVCFYSEVFTESNTSFYQVDIRKTSDFSLVTSQQFDSLVEDISISDHGDLLATTYHGIVTLYNLSEFTRNIDETNYSPLPEPKTSTPYLITDFPTETPFPTLVMQILQVPTESMNAINKQNAVNLHEVGRTGLGKVQSVTWQSNGDLQIVSAEGLFILDGQTLDVLQQYSISDLNVTAGIESNASLFIVGDIPFGDVQLWDGNTGEINHQFINGSQPAISLNGKWLAYIVEGKGVYTWNLETNLTGPLLQVDDFTVSQPVFSSDNRYVAAALEDRSIRIWDIEKGVVANSVGGPVVPVSNFAFSRDGKFIVAASGGSVWWWNLDTDESSHLELFEPEYWYNYAYDVLTFPDVVTSVSMNSNNSLLAIGTNQGKILFYDINSYEFTEQILKPNASAMKLGFNTNSTQLYSVDKDGQLIIWSLKDGSRVAQNHLFRGSFMGLATDLQSEVSIWGVNTLWRFNSNSISITEPIYFDVEQIFDMNPEKNIVAGYSSPEVSIYDAGTGDHIKTLPKENEQVSITVEASMESVLNGGSFSQDGNRLVLYGEQGLWMYGNQDYELIDFYNAELGKKALFNPDGEIILYASGEHPVVIQMITFNPAKKLHPLPFAYGSFLFSQPEDIVDQYAISPDNRYVAVYTYHGLGLYEINSGQKIVEMDLEYQVMSVAYNPTGTLIAVGLKDGSVLMLDANTLETVTTLQAHTASVNHLVFTLDGDKLITAAEDGVVKVWGVK